MIQDDPGANIVPNEALLYLLLKANKSYQSSISRLLDIVRIIARCMFGTQTIILSINELFPKCMKILLRDPGVIDAP